MIPQQAQWVPRAIRTSFGIQSVGTNNFTPQNKYLHTQAQKFDVEVSAKNAILAIFKGWNADFPNAETCTKSPQSVLWAPGDVEHQ